MSVHSEYHRALEAFVNDLKKLGANATGNWLERLVAARSGQDTDLSTAARHCLEVLRELDAAHSLSAVSGIGPDADPLREPFLHLRAHCHTILGLDDRVGHPE